MTSKERYVPRVTQLSVNKICGTFGQQLLSVRYGREFNKNKAYLLAVLTIGSKYLKQRSHEIASATRNPSMSEKVKLLFQWADKTIQVASLVNLLMFLSEGKHPTLADRILGLQPVSLAPSGQSRTVGYSYMTRELLWHGFIELLIFAVPLVNYHALKRRASNLFLWRKKDNDNRGVTFTKCAECNETPVLPHHMGCSHIFCFYCIKANHLADEKYECPLCGFTADDATSVIPLHL
ncbi:peroxisome biogenesis factor 2 isoform X2 [Zootermopsis nevadensis]|uniref:peroxisome biogenesis factor 2 isoform X2 n=1 Tax=Zootermopsis nevadensis TaxID=136037 RepID=UPI000B8EA3BA|nr:peroxisome biogenesis factor 2 isoform X2 [Zootermopsis nevadensis]